jgi:hypothetical protein
MRQLPAWLDALVDIVAASMTAHGPIGPLGLRYREEEQHWEVIVYPLPLEMIGGAYDGGLAAPNFTLQLPSLLAAFGQVDSVNWEALGAGSEDIPCLSIEGSYQQHALWLRLLAYAPDDVGPGLKVDANEQRKAG